MAKNAAEIIRQGGDLYYADWQAIPTLTASNLATVKGILDGLSFDDVGLISGFEAAIQIDNVQELNGMNCGYGTIFTEADQTANLTTTLLQTRGLDFWNNLIQGFRGSIAASPVSVTAEAHGTGWTVGTPFRLNHKDADNTIVGSIVIKEDGVALTLDTDYKTYVGDGVNGDLGWTYITPIAAQTGVITADYSYTPAAAEMLGMNFEKIVLPYGIYKFIGCEYTDGAETKQDIMYFVKMRLDGEAAIRFVNTGDQPEGSELTLIGELGGQFFWYQDVV